MGTFRIGLHSLHSLHCFLLLRERGILIDHQNLVDTQPASSPCIIKTVNLTIIKSQSQVRLMHGIPRGWGGTCRGPNRRPNRRPNYACCRNYNQTVALFCGVNALGRFLPEEPSPPRCAIFAQFFRINSMIPVSWTICRDRFWYHLDRLGPRSSFSAVNLVTYYKFYCLKRTKSHLTTPVRKIPK